MAPRSAEVYFAVCVVPTADHPCVPQTCAPLATLVLRALLGLRRMGMGSSTTIYVADFLILWENSRAQGSHLLKVGSTSRGGRVGGYEGEKVFVYLKWASFLALF